MGPDTQPGCIDTWGRGLWVYREKELLGVGLYVVSGFENQVYGDLYLRTVVNRQVLSILRELTRLLNFFR